MHRPGLVALLLLTLSTPALAQQAAPWQTAGAAIRATMEDTQKDGEEGFKLHVAELEGLLAQGAEQFPPRVEADGKLVILVDGMTEAMMAQQLSPPPDITIVTAPNPYPQIGLMLAFHYNETGRPQEALRVVTAALKLSPMAEMHRGARLASLMTETAAAYVSLNRWDDSLNAAEAALEASQTDPDRARSLRAKGFALVELGRLDDAETAYRSSLRLEPDNALAQSEMGDILRRRNPSQPQ